MICNSLSLKGLGQGAAECPSLEQLMGITDINDPCQSGAIPVISPALSTDITSLISAGINPTSGGSIPSVGASAGTANWVLLGAVLFGIVLFAEVVSKR